MTVSTSNTYILPAQGSTLVNSRDQFNSSLRALLQNFYGEGVPDSGNYQSGSTALTGSEINGALYRSSNTGMLYIYDSNIDATRTNNPVGSKFTRYGMAWRQQGSLAAAAANIAKFDLGEAFAVVNNTEGGNSANNRLYLRTRLSGTFSSDFIDVGTPPAGTISNVQVFSTPGIKIPGWVKPSGFSPNARVLLQIWGGGGSGGKGSYADWLPAGGGGGGTYWEGWKTLSELSANHALEVGAGGAAVSALGTPGNYGSASWFRGWGTSSGNNLYDVAANGGGGGDADATGSGGGGGGPYGFGGSGNAIAAAAAGLGMSAGGYGGGGAGGIGGIPNSYSLGGRTDPVPPINSWGGAGGGQWYNAIGDWSCNGAGTIGGGGGGGGAYSLWTGWGGGSVSGGNGGNGANGSATAESGKFPGGGGGGKSGTVGNSGAGGDGLIIVTVYSI